MFLNNLSEAQQSSFLTIAARLCAVDGVDPRETSQMAMFERETGKSVVDDGVSMEELCGGFTSRVSKMSALIELIAISYADDVQSDEEIQLLTRVSELWELSDDDIDQAASWVARQRDLLYDAAAILEGN